jgi:hypothetical protein
VFDGCINLNHSVGENWDVSKVTDMVEMFCNCFKLDQKTGSKWNTIKLININYMFDGCKKLSHPVGKNWNISDIQNINLRGAFRICDKYPKDSLEKWNLTEEQKKLLFLSN